MFFRKLPTTLHQIICEIILNSKVIDISILDPDDTEPLEKTLKQKWAKLTHRSCH